jgi:hypothetical protein
MFLFDENTQRLRTGEVLFASVPSIIALGAKEDIWVTTKRMTQNVKSCELAILNKQFDAAKLELRPLSELYNEYMDILLSPNPQDKLLYISQSFTTLIPNIFAGFWSHRVLQEKGFTLACFSGIDTTSYYKELKWDERVLLDSGAHILSAREAAISKIQKAKV